jgi:hypothetical protein
MRVVDWIGYREESAHETSVGGLGGWFDGHTWQDYLDNFQPETHPYYEAIRESIIEKKHWINGERHQNGDDGVPLFEDGTIGSFSFRAWGDLMAAISESVDHGKHNYMEFYYCMSPSTFPGAPVEGRE